MLKMVIGFFTGIAVCGLFVIWASAIIPTHADTQGISDNVTDNFTGLLPDIEGIYRESLNLPFEMAESKIYDEDVAEFYRELMERTGLGGGGSGMSPGMSLLCFRFYLQTFSLSVQGGASFLD